MLNFISQTQGGVSTVNVTGTTQKCQHDQICAKCGDFGHDYNSCKEVPFCYHCHQDHPTSYKKCPMFLLEKLIIEDKVRSNVTFREARNKIYHLNPQLTSQIPHLNQSRPQNSYSNTSASSPVSSDVHKILLQQQKQIALLNDHIAKLLAVIPNSKQSRVSESSDSNMDTSLPNIPHYQRKRNVKKTTDGKRRRRDSLSSFDGDSSPSDRSSPNRRKTPNSHSNKSVPSTRQEGSNVPATNLTSPPAQGALPSEKGAASTRQEVKIMPDLPSQFGQMANAGAGDNPPHSVEASGGKATTGEEGGGANPPPKTAPSAVTSSKKPKPTNTTKNSNIKKITGPPKK